MNWFDWLTDFLWGIIGVERSTLWLPGEGHQVRFEGLSGKAYLIVRLARYRRYRRRGGDWGPMSAGSERFDAWMVTDEWGDILTTGPLTYGKAINYIWEQGPTPDQLRWVNGQGSGFATAEEVQRFLQPTRLEYEDQQLTKHLEPSALFRAFAQDAPATPPGVLYLEPAIGSFGRIAETAWIEEPEHATEVLARDGKSVYQITPMSPWTRQSFWRGRVAKARWRRQYQSNGSRIIRYSWSYRGVRMSDAPLRMMDAMRACEHHRNTTDQTPQVIPCVISTSSSTS